MPMNVEIKARIPNTAIAMSALCALGAECSATLHQEDTLFAVPRGRLKMRCDEEGVCELVYYRRENQTGPCISSYFRQPLTNPSNKKAELQSLFGIKKIVRKRRLVFIACGARVHIDDVEGLGQFLEIEVPFDRKADAHRAAHLTRMLMMRLSISDRDLIAGAYEDLFTGQK
jgi:predicted adenylyl cyclase CyaB